MKTARVILDLCIFAVTQPSLLKIASHKHFWQESRDGLTSYLIG